MAFSKTERQLLQELNENISNHFIISDEDFEVLFSAIKRERRDKLGMAKQQIQHHLAKKLNWTFAMDGGFIWQGCKEWTNGTNMFAMLYKEYEKLMLKYKDFDIK